LGKTVPHSHGRSSEAAEEVALQCYNPYLARPMEASHDWGGSHGGRSEASLEDIIDSIIRNSLRSGGIPDSISILINFGTEKNHILYSTNKKDHNCRWTYCVCISMSSYFTTVLYFNKLSIF
jgi:hypothetical protein